MKGESKDTGSLSGIPLGGQVASGNTQSPLCSVLSDSFAAPWTVHGIFQARILEWVAISNSRESPQPRDQTCVSCVSCTGRQIFFTISTPWEAHSSNGVNNTIILMRITKTMHAEMNG